MQINIQGQNVEVTDAIKDYINKKLKRLESFDSFITSIDFHLHIDHLSQVAEAQIMVRGGQIHAKADSEDMYAAIDTLTDRMIRQLTKFKEKHTAHRE